MKRSNGDPLISVILPAFNAERTLRETLNSAAAQTYRNLEIIVVDDGSMDGTGRIAQEFCAAETRARLIRQENSGVASARNRGIGEASGNWIASLDSDDVWHPDKLSRQMATACQDGEAGLVYCWSRLIDDSGRVVANAPTARFGGDVLSEHLRSNFIGNGSTPMFRRDLIQGLRYRSEVDPCADYLLQLELSMRTSFAVVPAYLTGYRVTDGNMSSDAIRMIRSHIDMYRILRPRLNAADRRIAAHQLAQWTASHGLVLLRRGKLAQGAVNLASAAFRGPTAAFRQCLWLGERKLRTRRRDTAVSQHTGVPFSHCDPDEY